jgi:hypothetical protein
MSTPIEPPLLASTIRRRIDAEIDDEDMAKIFMTIASAIPCLRVSSGIDFTSGNDVRQWLAAEARRIQRN